MNLVPCLYYGSDRVVALDISTGTLQESTSNHVHGSVTEVGRGPRKTSIAIYGDDGILYFQVGSRRWNIEAQDIFFKCGYVRFTIGFLKRFQAASHDEGILFSLKYFNPYWKHPLNWIDFTYDELDAELDDFFIWACGRNDLAWRNEFRLRLTQGIVVSRPCAAK